MKIFAAVSKLCELDDAGAVLHRVGHDKVFGKPEGQAIRTPAGETVGEAL